MLHPFRKRIKQHYQISPGKSHRLFIATAVALGALLLIPATSHCQSRTRTDNAGFILQGLGNLADTLVFTAAPHLSQRSVLLNVESELYQDRLSDLIAQRLQAQHGVDVFLDAAKAGENISFETQLDDLTLSYVGIGRGIFRYPAVERRLMMDAFGRVIDPEGKLLTTFAVADLVFSDTLSYADAEASTGSGSLLAPSLPPSPYSRLVEPGLVLAVTGVLVYVFFASR